MKYSRRVVGYHGTDTATAQALLRGTSFEPSTSAWDWLGSGIYFWEFGYDRALEWAETSHPTDGAVIGALIQLGNCYDLLDTRFTRDLAAAADLFHTSWPQDKPLPVNRGNDLKARYLDCAVINWWLPQLAGQGTEFQTIRCGFTEGGPVFEGMGIQQQTHIQICVRDPTCVVGVFLPTGQ